MSALPGPSSSPNGHPYRGHGREHVHGWKVCSDKQTARLGAETRTVASVRVVSGVWSPRTSVAGPPQAANELHAAMAVSEFALRAVDHLPLDHSTRTLPRLAATTRTRLETDHRSISAMATPVPPNRNPTPKEYLPPPPTPELSKPDDYKKTVAAHQDHRVVSKVSHLILGTACSRKS